MNAAKVAYTALIEVKLKRLKMEMRMYAAQQRKVTYVGSSSDNLHGAEHVVHGVFCSCVAIRSKRSIERVLKRHEQTHRCIGSRVNRSEQRHVLLFDSTVQLPVNVVLGKTRTKKQADMNATKVAYTALIEEAKRREQHSENGQKK
uniref:Double-stranded RNA-binding n=1 Tax=Tanacetum cinerariifolium TaxID=118510 RepID=A0A6L2NK15_TANCI|nr:hypothetical protein [Tanacetum cinerariifolium]